MARGAKGRTLAKDDVTNKNKLDDLEPEDADAIKGGGPATGSESVERLRRSTARKLPEGALRDTVRPDS